MFYWRITFGIISISVVYFILYLIHGKLEAEPAIFGIGCAVVFWLFLELDDIKEQLTTTNKELDRVIDQLQQIAKNTYKTANKD